MDAFLLDLRYAARALRKNPRFTLLVTATLALGIGANTAVFGLVDAWLLRPLRFQDPDRLVIVLGSHVTRPTEPAIFPLYRDVVAWTEESRSFERMAGVFWRRYLLTGRGDPEQVSGMVVTTELFDTLGVAPLVGRTFNRDDLHGPPRVVLGHALWLRLTGGSPDAVGSLTLNGRPHEVIGVMPRDFDFRILDQPAGALWTLLQPGEANYEPQSTGALAVIGRLKPDVTASAAQTELLAIQERVERQFADGLRQHLPLVTALQADNTRTVGATLFTLTAAVGFVLLIACTNIATLLVGRASLRQKDFAIRAALGSGRGRLLRQALAESLVLSAIGMLGGLVVARVALDAFVAANPIGTLPPQPIGVDVRTLAFTIAISSLALLLSGLLPALGATRVDLNDVLTRTAGRSSAARASLRVQDALLVGQIGLSVILLSGAVLMLTTLLRLHSEPMGLRTEGVATMRIALAPGEYEDPARRNRLYDGLLAQIAALPGVERAGFSSSGPLSGGYGVRVTVDGDALPASDRRADRAVVTPDYFQALSIPLISGRALTDQDHERSAPVVVINDALARSAFSDTSPLGRRIRIGEESQWRTVVGIVGNTRSTFYNTLEWRTEPFMYVPHRQSMATGFGPVSQDVWAYVRTMRPLPLTDVRRAVSRVSTSAAVAEYDDLGAVVANATRQAQLRAGLLAAFSAVAVFLAAIGIYGVTLQSVAQRTREIGIRIALGAVTRQINMMVLSRGLTLAVTGFALGIAGSAALAQALSGLLYGVRPTDPRVFALVGVVLLSVAGLAAYVPARRASRVSPTVVLRYE